LVFGKAIMTTKQAIEKLRELRQGCDESTGDALDMAIALLDRSIVKADIEAIIKGVERETGVTEAEMCNRGRQREFAEARAIVSWLARRYTSMTLTSIGKRLGRDRISVIHYVRMVGSWMEEPRLNIRGARITQKLIDEIEQ
jgi:chromosomal replication initiation ATPase DnaA